jgi:hypothetical protein
LSQGGMHRSLTPSRWQWCLAARVMAVLQPMRGSNKRRHTSGSGRHTLDYWRDNQWWEHQGCSLVAAEVGVAGSLPCWDLGEEQGRMPEGMLVWMMMLATHVGVCLSMVMGWKGLWSGVRWDADWASEDSAITYTYY